MTLIRRLIPLLFPLILLFIGCADDITQTGNTVTVHLSDINGFDYPSLNYIPNISIGSYPVSLTDPSGSHTFPNVSKPYSITVQGKRTCFQFNNLTISNPYIVAGKFNELYGGMAYQTCALNVHMQSPGDFHIAILRFISKDKFLEVPEGIITPYYGEPYMYVDIPDGVNSISGKLVLLYCEGDYYEDPQGLNTLEIYSYDSMAIKDITLYPGNNDPVTFAHQDMITDLHQTDIKYSIESNYSPYNNAYLSFPGYSGCSDIMVYRYNYSSYYFPVPADFPIPFEVKMMSVTGNSSLSMRPQVITKGSVGTEFYLQHKQIELLTPRYGITGVNDTTIFRFDDEIEHGIYAVEIDGKYLTFTDKKEITFGDMKSRLYLPLRATEYYWRVYKISEFSDVNDFLSEPYNFGSKFSRISISSSRKFRTAE